MNTASTLIGLSLLLLFVGPVLLLIFQQHKKQNELVKKFQFIVHGNQLEPEIIEISGSLSLGLDLKNRKLPIVEPQNNGQFLVIDLSKLKEIHIRTVENKHNRGRINHVSLELLGENSKIGEIIFYDEDDNENIDADARLVMAKKWNDLIKKAA